MDIRLPKSKVLSGKVVVIPGSKSETNRLLILRALYPEISISNISPSDDSRVLLKALESNENKLDVGHAGTAMRFLTAYFSMQRGRTTMLTGSERMQQRPIGPLVEALRNLGAIIDYIDKDGFPPLAIEGRNLKGGSVKVSADISSQFITSLMLIGPKLANGITIDLDSKITSAPYIEMTAELLRRCGISVSFDGNRVEIPYCPKVQPQGITVEPDWSSASYFYSMVALSDEGTSLHLKNFRRNSIQGDSILPMIYEQFGVSTQFSDDGITIIKGGDSPNKIDLDLNRNPDLAQTIAVTCLGLGVDCRLSGLHTLKIKETDRISAMKSELSKFGVLVSADGDSISFGRTPHLPSDIFINTYDDHRMALAFAPLSVKVPLSIENPDVVTKSFPGFWEIFQNVCQPNV